MALSGRALVRLDGNVDVAAYVAWFVSLVAIITLAVFNWVVNTFSRACALHGKINTALSLYCACGLAKVILPMIFSKTALAK